MKYTTYTKMPILLRQHLPFAGNSVRATWIGEPCGSNVCQNKTGRQYVVISYQTEILRICYECKMKIFQQRFYSMTTSKLQGILRRTFNLPPRKRKR